MALPPDHRLRHRRDFKAVYHKGFRRCGRHLTLRGRRQSELTQYKSADESQPPTRIGISISQKVSKKAVVRNRIKRQLRAALRLLLPRIAPGWHLVLVVHPQAKECEFAQFLRELEKLLVEAEVFHGH